MFPRDLCRCKLQLKKSTTEILSSIIKGKRKNLKRYDSRKLVVSAANGGLHQVRQFQAARVKGVSAAGQAARFVNGATVEDRGEG